METVGENTLIEDRYRILRKIGDGGMGNIFLAEDLKLSRQVAVKTIRPELKDNSEVRQRIDRECKLHATLGVHANIIALYDKIEHDDNVFLIMEYVDGKTLSALLKRDEKGGVENKELSLSEIVSMASQVLEALEHIHDHDILHRDIKPSNIMLQEKSDGRLTAKLMDFGIASLDNDEDDFTQITTLDAGGPGTPTYMAPERIDSSTFGEVGPPTDIYSVGIILYELLGGDPPFKGTITEVFTGHLAKEPDLSRLPDSLPEKILDVIKDSLAKKQNQRFQDAGSFARALRKARTLVSKESQEVSNIEEPGLEHTVLYTGRHKEAVSAAINQATVNKDSRKKLLIISCAAVVVASLVVGGWLLTKESSEEGSASKKSSVNEQNITTKSIKEDDTIIKQSQQQAASHLPVETTGSSTKSYSQNVLTVTTGTATPDTDQASGQQKIQRDPFGYDLQTATQQPESVPNPFPVPLPSVSAEDAFRERRAKMKIENEPSPIKQPKLVITRKEKFSSAPEPPKTKKSTAWEVTDRSVERQ